MFNQRNILPQGVLYCIVLLFMLTAAACCSADENPENKKVMKGIEYLIAGLNNDAIQAFNEALEINPESFIAYHNRGLAYKAKGDFTKAIEDISRALELKNDVAKAYHSRALLYEQEGQIDLALLDYNKALEINPVFPEALQDRAIAYFFKKDYEKSWEDVVRVETLGYTVDPDFRAKLTAASGREQ